MKNKTTLAVLCAALGNIIWGFSFPLITLGLKMVPQTHIMLGHRFTISAIVMLGMILFGKKNKLSFKGKNWKPVVFFLGLLCSIVANLLVNYAMSRMSVFKVASFGALSTPCVLRCWGFL